MLQMKVLHAGLLAGVLTLTAVPAAAQRVPDTGMVAIGFTAGISRANDEALTRGVDLGAQVERYFTPRVSIRGKVSSPWFDILGRPFGGTIQPVAFEGNIVHNWERGVWHPFVTGGIGVYRFRFKEPDIDSLDTKLGFNFGGGVEYFFRLHDTVFGEATVRAIPGRTTSLASDYETGYWTLAVGYKKYF
jgi:hypothetical protein